MDEDDELRRLRSRNALRLGRLSRRARLIAETVCSSAASITEESRELCAAAGLLRAEVARLRRERPRPAP